MAAKKSIYSYEADDRTERASKEYRATKRTPTYDNIEDIPKLDLDKKVEEAAENAVEEATKFTPVDTVAPNKKNIIRSYTLKILRILIIKRTYIINIFCI